MHRIDGEGNVAGMFTEGDPGLAIPATVVSDDWLNDVQENLAQAIEAAGIALVKGNYAQLTAAINALAAAATAGHSALTAPHSATSDATASRLVLRDANGRAQFADPSSAQDAATKAYVDVPGASGSFTLLSGFTSAPGGLVPGWFYKNGMVFLQGAIDVSASAVTGPIHNAATNIPVQYRPSASVHFPARIGSTPMSRGYVDNLGRVYWSGGSAAGEMILDGCCWRV